MDDTNNTPETVGVIPERLYREDPLPSKHNTVPFSIEDMPNLDTIEGARTWLLNPHNWFRGTLFILKWEGLVPTVAQSHAETLWREPWNDDLPWCVVASRRMKRLQAAKGQPEGGETKDERERVPCEGGEE
jgi:hypothetical protein